MHCSKCKTAEGPLLIRGTRKDGLKQYHCRPCQVSRCKRYRSTTSGKASVARSIRKYRQNNPDRVMAWYDARKIKRQPCDICGDQNTHRHHDDPAMTLNVIFLCPAHHIQRHRLLRSLEWASV